MFSSYIKLDQDQSWASQDINPDEARWIPADKAPDFGNVQSILKLAEAELPRVILVDLQENPRTLDILPVSVQLYIYIYISKYIV